MAAPLRSISKLQGSRVLILGETSGVGFAVAQAAVEHGASVIVSSSKATKVADAVSRLQTIHTPLPSTADEVAVAAGFACDLGDAGTLEANLRALLESATTNRTHLLDHVVYTAGDALTAASMANATAESLQRQQVVRLLGPTLLGKLLPNYIHNAARSSYTLTGAITHLKPSPALAAYTGLTAAVEGTARGLAVAMRPVRVNAVLLGLVPTELHGSMPEELRQTIFEGYRKSTLVDEVGRVEDAAEPYIYCMKNGFATGSVLVCDGGKVLT